MVIDMRVQNKDREGTMIKVYCIVVVVMSKKWLSTKLFGIFFFHLIQRTLRYFPKELKCSQQFS